MRSRTLAQHVEPALAAPGRFRRGCSRRTTSRTARVILAVTAAAATVAAVGFLAGCGRHGEVDPAKARNRVQRAVRESLEERGGPAALERVAGYRAEGLITLVPERRVAEFVRWYDPAGRMRLEFREEGRGEVRIISEGGTWSGSDDPSLVFGETSLRDVLALASARRDFPLPFAGHEDSLALASHDKKKRTVYRARSQSGVLVDHHLEGKKGKLTAISVQAEEEPDFVLRVELGAYRKIRGARFPFKETVYLGKEKLAEVRFRNVIPDPELPPALFVPRVSPAAPDSGGSGGLRPDQ